MKQVFVWITVFFRVVSKEAAWLSKGSKHPRLKRVSLFPLVALEYSVLIVVLAGVGIFVPDFEEIKDG